MMSVEEEREFLTGYVKLWDDPDRSKVLTIHAIVGYEDGNDYTERDYEKAIERITEAIAKNGDTEDGFLYKGILWCRARATAKGAIA